MLAFARTSHEKRELMGNRGDQKGKDVSAMAAAELIQEAKKTQEQDLEAVNRMKKMVEASEEVGVEANIKLKLQTEQLKNIHVEVDTVNVRRPPEWCLMSTILLCVEEHELISITDDAQLGRTYRHYPQKLVFMQSSN